MTNPPEQESLPPTVIATVTSPLGGRKTASLHTLLSAYDAFDIPDPPNEGWPSGITKEASKELLVVLAPIRKELTRLLQEFAWKLVVAFDRDPRYSEWEDSPYKEAADGLEDIYRALAAIEQFVMHTATKTSIALVIADLAATVGSRFAVAKCLLKSSSNKPKNHRDGDSREYRTNRQSQNT